MELGRAILLVTPPGVRAFYNGTEYAHGGISPQECVLPVIDVTADGIAPSLSHHRDMEPPTASGGGERRSRDDGRCALGADAYGPSLLTKGSRRWTTRDRSMCWSRMSMLARGLLVIYHPERRRMCGSKLVTKVEG